MVLHKQKQQRNAKGPQKARKRAVEGPHEIEFDDLPFWTLEIELIGVEMELLGINASRDD